MIATATMAQGVIDVHSHIITPEFVSTLENEGRLMDEGFPLPKYDVENHLKWMDEVDGRGWCGDIGIDIGGTTTFVSGDGEKNQ